MKQIVLVGLLASFVVLVELPTIAQDATSQTASRTFKTFAEWCNNKVQLTPEVRHIVEVLVEKAGTQACDRAQKVLASRTELRLADNLSFLILR